MPPRLLAVLALAALLAGCTQPPAQGTYAFYPRDHDAAGQGAVADPLEVAFERIEVDLASRAVRLDLLATAIWGDATNVTARFDGCPAEGDRCASPGGVVWSPAEATLGDLARDVPSRLEAVATLPANGTFLLEVHLRADLGPDRVGGYRRCFVVLLDDAPPQVYIDTPPGVPEGRAMAVPVEA